MNHNTNNTGHEQPNANRLQRVIGGIGGLLRRNPAAQEAARYTRDATLDEEILRSTDYTVSRIDNGGVSYKMSMTKLNEQGAISIEDLRPPEAMQTRVSVLRTEKGDVSVLVVRNGDKRDVYGRLKSDSYTVAPLPGGEARVVGNSNKSNLIESSGLATTSERLRHASFSDVAAGAGSFIATLRELNPDDQYPDVDSVPDLASEAYAVRAALSAVRTYDTE